MIVVTKDFITPEEESELLSHLKPTQVTSGVTRNKIERYGSPLPYTGPIRQIPTWLTDIAMRVTREWQHQKDYKGKVDHITVNEYHKNQSIDWHIDSKTSGNIITVLSLELDAIMGVKSPEIKIELPRRSLLHMTEEDRWDKQHCIYPVNGHRWSLVFRKGTPLGKS